LVALLVDTPGQKYATTKNVNDSDHKYNNDDSDNNDSDNHNSSDEKAYDVWVVESLHHADLVLQVPHLGRKQHTMADGRSKKVKSAASSTTINSNIDHHPPQLPNANVKSEDSMQT
jgi:hypothetical protein